MPFGADEMHHWKLFVLIAALVLGGCKAMLRSDALKQGEERCARDGKQFVELDRTEKFGVFDPTWSITLAGVCVGPDDPRYQPVL